MSEAVNILKADNLCKSYKGRKVVHGVSMEIHSGEVIGLLGPNGAGKTTSFYMVAGLVAADQGNITLGDKDITPLPNAPTCSTWHRIFTSRSLYFS